MRLNSYVGLSIPLGLTLILHGLAGAQAIERHQPPSEVGKSAPIVAPNAVPAEEDDTAIGPELKGLVVTDRDQTSEVAVIEGVDVSSVARLFAVKVDIEADLKPFLGQKISRKLIAEIEAAIARRYRSLGYPFVALSTPEQKISGGQLKVRVLEFLIGDVRTSGLPTGAVKAVRNQIDLKPGDPIDTFKLGSDLSWLNRYPYRSVQAVFMPSQIRGATDLILAGQTVRPWRLFVGYDNSGSPSSTFDRYRVGGAVGGLLGQDSLISVQATKSQGALNGAEHPKYASEALNYTLPIFRRVLIEVSYDHIETNHLAGDFQDHSNTDEGSLGLRFWAPFGIYPSLQSDIRFGIKAKHQDAVVLFGGNKVVDQPSKGFILFAGSHLEEQTYAAHSVLDVAIYGSLKGTDHADSDAQALSFSQGRAHGARFAYASMALEHAQSVTKQISWTVQMSGQWASQALPRTEQIGLGGPFLIRGYTLDTGAFDSSLILRNEFHVMGRPAWSRFANPFVFLDTGIGWDQQRKADTKLSSVGLGANPHILDKLNLYFSLAKILVSNQSTRAGNWKAYVSVSVSY